MSKIEEVAMAMCNAAHDHDDGAARDWNSNQGVYRQMARAAIKAMRINTAEMCKAGRDAIDDAEIGISCGITIDYRSVACWQAMIDAALAEEAKR